MPYVLQIRPAKLMHWKRYFQLSIQALIYGTTFVVLVSSNAHASCVYYSSIPSDQHMALDAPVGIICFEDKCDRTQIRTECGNVHSGFVEYEIGWAVSHDLDNGTFEITWKGNPIAKRDYVKITCYNLDRNFCQFPSELNYSDNQ